MTTRTMPARKRPPAASPASGNAWLAALLAAFGTFALACLLSPGLRSDIGWAFAFFGEMDAAGVRAWLLSFGVFSPLVFFLIMVAQVVVNPIPSAPVTLAGALVFGVLPGLALSMAGAVVGSAIVFLAVRRWGAPLVIRLVGEAAFHKYAGRLDAKGWGIFAIFLIPLMPDDAICALAGLSAVSFRRFLVVMSVGRLPGATLTALLASDGISHSTATLATAGLLAAALLIPGFIYRHRVEAWLLHKKDGK